MNTISEKIIKNKNISITFLNIILIVLLIILKDPFGIFIKTYDTSPKFLDLNISDVSKVVYKRKDDPSSTKELFREKSEWLFKLTDNSVFKADEEKVNSMLKTLLDSRKYTIAASGKEKFSEFGFVALDALEVEIYNSKNELGGRFTLGNAAGGGSFTNVLFNDSEDIYVVEESLKPLFGRGSDDHFINKRITPNSMGSQDIIQFTLISKNPKNNLDFTKKEFNWEKSGEVLDQKIIDPIVNRLALLSADSVLKKEDVGLLENINISQLNIIYKDSNTGIQNILGLIFLGKDKSDYYYLKKENEKAIYKITGNNFKSILDLMK